MRIAIMQPYFLPYIGYWQLITSVDKFILLDDVNFINRGWINRNRISLNGSPAWLTLPLKKASQNKLIYELEINEDDGWKKRMAKTIEYSYSKAPWYREIADGITYGLIRNANGNLSRYLYEQIFAMTRVLGIETEIVPSSRIFPRGAHKGQERIIDICRQVGACKYINLPGGRILYDPARFRSECIELEFLEVPAEVNLPSGNDGNQPLSILDTLMYNSVQEVRRYIVDFKTSKPKT